MKIFSQTTHRNILETLLKKYLPTLKGEILDIGSKNRRYDSLLSEKPVAIDTIPNMDQDVIFGDMHALPFENSRFSSVLAIETIEYATDPNTAIQEILRVLKEDGVFVMSVPFIFPSHGDCVRFTEKYLKEVLLSDFTEVVITPIGNSVTVLLDLLRNIFFSLKNPLLKYFSLPFFALFMLPLFCMKKDHREEDRYASGYFVIAKK